MFCRPLTYGSRWRNEEYIVYVKRYPGYARHKGGMTDLMGVFDMGKALLINFLINILLSQSGYNYL